MDPHETPGEGDRALTASGPGPVEPDPTGDGLTAPARVAGGVPRSGPIVPDWLSNLAAVAWRVLAITGLVIVLWFIASLLWTVTASIAVATVVSAVAAPWVLRMTRQGRSRTAAAAIAWTAAILSVTGLVAILLLAFLPSIGSLVSRVDAGLTAIEAEVASLGLPPELLTALHDLLRALRSAGSGASEGALSSLGGIVTVLVLSVFLVFFFLRDGDKGWAWSLQALSPEKRDTLTTAARDALVRVGGYLRGTAVLSAIVAFTDLVFMLILGVPLAVPLALLVLLAGFIPYFGGIVATVAILVVTFAALGLWPVVILLVLIAVRNAILGWGVRPALYGRTTNIHPALVLIVLPAGYQVAGVIGLFVAVPAAAIVLAVGTALVAIIRPEEPPPLPALVPDWLDRVAQWSWRLVLAFALVGVGVAIFLTIPTVVIPLILAVVLAATLEPVVNVLMRRGRSRGSAAAVTVGGGFLAVVLVMVLAFVSLVAQAGPLVDGAASGATRVNGVLGGHLGPLVNVVVTGGGQILDTIRDVAQGVATTTFIVVVSVLLSFYMLRDGGHLWARFVARSRPGLRATVQAAGGRAVEVLGGYMAGTAAISLVGAGSQLAIMLILGIDLALPVFVLSFFLCFIPYIGGFLSTGIALLLTIAQGSPADVAVMAVFTIVFNIVTGNIVSPIVYGKTVHLHPAVVLVAIPAGSAIAGVLGMFFVVPAIGVVAVTWRSVLVLMGARATAAAAALDTTSTSGPAAAEAVTDAGAAGGG